MRLCVSWRRGTLLVLAVLLLAGINACDSPNEANQRPNEGGQGPNGVDQGLNDENEARRTAASDGILANPAGPVTSKACAQGELQLFDSLEGDSNVSCTELQVRAHGLVYRGFLFSRGDLDSLVIYHEGHLACLGMPYLANTIREDAVNLIASLGDHNDVLYLDMPGIGTHCGQEVPTAEGTLSITDHNVFASLDGPGESGLAYFLDHIGAMVDELSLSYARIDMLGRSGGGWATTLYSALDRRITRSVSIAGTLPLDLRGPVPEDPRDDHGDWEQSWALFYQILDYYDLYAAAGDGQPLLAGEGRRHTQIYNEFDLCCFSGAKAQLAAEAFVDRYPDHTSVQFVVLREKYEHAIPVSLVVQLLSEDSSVIVLPACRGVAIEPDSSSTCIVR